MIALTRIANVVFSCTPACVTAHSRLERLSPSGIYICEGVRGQCARQKSDGFELCFFVDFV